MSPEPDSHCAGVQPAHAGCLGPDAICRALTCVSGLQVAPLDFLQPDEDLKPELLDAARAAGIMWTQALQYPMLAYSAVVLVSEDGDTAPPANKKLAAFADRA